MESIKLKYKKAISDVLQCKENNVFLYWKGRIALYAVLKAMGIKEGDEIIIPAFTCVVVPNAILYLKAIPIYVDISPDNYNADPNLIKEALTSKTKVILCQNTFGLSSNVEEIIQIAKENNLYTVEDCTHGFGGYYNGKPNGSYCDAAFYSTQWNKPFSTGIGGFLVVNNEKLLDKVIALEKEKIKPRFAEKYILSFLIVFRKYLVNNFTQSFLVSFFRFLSRHNLIVGSNQGNELSGIIKPQEYFKDISDVQARAGLKQIKKIKELNILRKKNASAYTNFLKAKGKKYVSKSEFDNHIFLKYPLLVEDRERFVKVAQKNNIVLGDWFLSPLHPVMKELDPWKFDVKRFPISMEISKKIVNLPTEVKNNLHVLKFLSQNLELIN